MCADRSELSHLNQKQILRAAQDDTIIFLLALDAQDQS
jgi:hypothetical protein